jgi:hypothetical protein
LFSLTPLVLYSFSPLAYSFIHLPAIFAPYSPIPFSFSLSFRRMCLMFSLSSRHFLHLLSLFSFLPIPVLSLLVPTSATRYHFPLSHILFLLPIVLRFSYSLSSLLLFCVFVPLPFYSPSPCTFSRRVVFLFSPSLSKFSSVSPVSYPI